MLFLIVCNLLLDLLKTKEDNGYQLKNTDFKQSQKAYAGDLIIIAIIFDGYKEFLSLVKTFLTETRTMQAKLTKCRNLPMKTSDIVRTNGRTSTANTPYDPQLEIDGKEIDSNYPPIFYEVFGQEIFKDLSDKGIRSGVKSKLKDPLVRVDKDNGTA